MTTIKGEGYLKIGNKTIDNLIDNKTIGLKTRVYLIAVRMLNGWDNESLNIPISTYANRLGIDIQYAKKLVNKLIKEKLICRNGSLTTIPGDYDQWWWSGKNLPPPRGGNILLKGGSKVTPKKGVTSYPLNTPTLQSKQTRHLATPLLRKEILKLEGMDYFRAEMINDGNFELKFIEDLIKKYRYMVLYDSWLEYEDSSKIRNKPGFFLSLVEKYNEKR